ncbi:hypothetical protein [Enterovirga aerilata]|uniref:MerR family transcriptional regulator n=1 Tax=Enterovirga aerilata TaxID=2730920 RepID=A0A849I318_9HYPH|nr:hypothetical protein [Enterovirga sp. DB1703]NNM74196.1 hypothetical protein [Enterovirga sp. DB1703]
MRFETAQVLELAGISKETLRHWKGILAPISDHDGRSHRYTYPELVSLCVISQAVQKLGLPVSRFGETATWLFAEIEARTKPANLPMALLIVGSEMEFGDDRDLPEVETITVVRVDRVMERLRATVLDPGPQIAQLDLPFEHAKVVALTPSPRRRA